MVFYCCKEHQTEDFAKHKIICKQILAAEKKVEKEEKKLRKLYRREDVFVVEAGSFWVIYYAE
jgi:hypothetical protein